MNAVKAIVRTLLSLLMVGAGTMHFVNAPFFLRIMPPYLPWHREIVAVSGVVEIALGVLLWVPRYSRAAAWGIILLLIAVFPVNIHVYLHQELVPASPLAHFLRLPLQGVFILAAFWMTRRNRFDAPPADTGRA